MFQNTKKKVCQAAQTFVVNDIRSLSIIEGKILKRMVNELISVGAVNGKVDAEDVLPSSTAMQHKIIANREC